MNGEVCSPVAKYVLRGESCAHCVEELISLHRVTSKAFRFYGRISDPIFLRQVWIDFTYRLSTRVMYSRFNATSTIMEIVKWFRQSTIIICHMEQETLFVAFLGWVHDNSENEAGHVRWKIMKQCIIPLPTSCRLGWRLWNNWVFYRFQRLATQLTVRPVRNISGQYENLWRRGKQRAWVGETRDPLYTNNNN